MQTPFACVKPDKPARGVAAKLPRPERANKAHGAALVLTEFGDRMESIRLPSDPLLSLAGIDEIINRGEREAFVGLLRAIIEQPDGPVADRVRTLYECVQHHANDPDFTAWSQYQAVYWLSVAMGQFRPDKAVAVGV